MEEAQPVDVSKLSDDEIKSQLEHAGINATRYLNLWRVCGWALAMWLTLQGLGYAIGGDAVARTPSYYMLIHYGGGMHVQGALQTIIGAVFLYTLLTGDKRTRPVLEIFCGYCLLMSLLVFTSWWLVHKVVFGAPFGWGAFFVIAAGMILYPPVGYRER